MSEEEMGEVTKQSTTQRASKGGKARAEKLTPEQRSEIAKRAAKARWESDVPKATHSGVLTIGESTIPCAVLDDKTRVLSQGGFLLAIGRSRTPKGGTGVLGGVDELPSFLSASNLKPLVSKELRVSTTPVIFRDKTGKTSLGFQAEALNDVCWFFVDALESKKLRPNQVHIGEKCKVLVRSLTNVAIVALVDEATGYQAERALDELEKVLKKFISVELRKWVKTFPDSFVLEIARLRNVDLKQFKRGLPSYFGHITNDIVYRRLAPGVLEELQRITPKTHSGNRKHRFHQRLSEDTGHPRLREHLHAVITLMRACNQWDEFKEMIDRSLPRFAAYDKNQKLLFNPNED